MKTLNVIYWSRVGFGILAALVATLLVNLKMGNPLMNGITIGLAVYLITYYVVKWKFTSKVEQPTKLLTMGIGAYFLTFILCWVLFITPFLAPPTATFTMDTQNPVVGEAIGFDASSSVDPDGTIVSYVWNFGDDASSENVKPSHTYTLAGNYTVRLTVVDDHGISMSNTTTLTVNLPLDV
ncbi:PKD domain-containing protein [Candidatus Bathyarchaeota archaeon]|nr:PKD domain-containing protein [Candidatus Bathyarchaeota archaeon]